MKYIYYTLMQWLRTRPRGFFLTSKATKKGGARPAADLPSLAASVSCRARRAHSLLRTTGLTVLPTAHPRARSPGDSLFGLERAARAAGPRLALLADQCFERRATASTSCRRAGREAGISVAQSIGSSAERA